MSGRGCWPNHAVLREASGLHYMDVPIYICLTWGWAPWGPRYVLDWGDPGEASTINQSLRLFMQKIFERSLAKPFNGFVNIQSAALEIFLT